MKKAIYFLGLIILSACSASNTDTESAQVTKVDKDHIAIYDFHTANRCETCIKIENQTLQTLENHFKNEMEDQTIIFDLINAETPENSGLAEEYGAFGTTLAITIVKGDQKEIIDITNWAFDAVHGANFESELKSKIEESLAKL